MKISFTIGPMTKIAIIAIITIVSTIAIFVLLQQVYVFGLRSGLNFAQRQMEMAFGQTIVGMLDGCKPQEPSRFEYAVRTGEKTARSYFFYCFDIRTFDYEIGKPVELPNPRINPGDNGFTEQK